MLTIVNGKPELPKVIPILHAAMLVLLHGSFALQAVIVSVPELGAVLDPGQLSRREAGICMVSPGQIDRCIKAPVQRMQCTIAFGETRRGKVITYLDTDDRKFVSPDTRVGDTFTIQQSSDLIDAPGFQIWRRFAKRGQWRTVVEFNASAAVPSEDRIR